MKILRLKGGIGNQLFILSEALKLEELGQKIYIDDKTGFKRDKYHRHSILDSINLKFSSASTAICYFFFILDRTLSSFLTEGIYLDGYFQHKIDDKFVEKVMSAINLERFNKNLEENCALLHFRDYKGLSIDHSNLGIEYYRRVIKRFKGQGISSFHVAGEYYNILKREELQGLDEECKFKIINFTSFSDLEELLYLTNYSNIAISNSTYAWWIARFSTMKNQKTNIFIPSEEHLRISHSWNVEKLCHPDWEII